MDNIEDHFIIFGELVKKPENFGFKYWLFWVILGSSILITNNFKDKDLTETIWFVGINGETTRKKLEDYFYIWSLL